MGYCYMDRGYVEIGGRGHETSIGGISDKKAVNTNHN